MPVDQNGPMKGQISLRGHRADSALWGWNRSFEFTVYLSHHITDTSQPISSKLSQNEFKGETSSYIKRQAAKQKKTLFQGKEKQRAGRNIENLPHWSKVNDGIYFFFEQPGKFTSVSNENKLRSAMATYYDFFSRNTQGDKPIISIPYVDAFGSGNDLFVT